MADLVARGADARAAVRTTAWLGGGVAVAACLACVAAWGPLTDGLFGGRPELTVALVAGLAGYALSYFARGLAGGVRWFGGYGLVLLADGGIRLIVALPLLVWASTTLAAIAIAAAAVGGALAPLLSRDRGALLRVGGDGAPSAPFAFGAAARFAAPAAVMAGCEQLLLSGGPLIVLIRGGEGAAATAGVLFAAALLVRAPVFLFQGVAASLLANFTTYRAQGDSRPPARRHGQGRADLRRRRRRRRARRADRRPVRDGHPLRRRLRGHARRPRAALARHRRLPRREHVLAGAAGGRRGRRRRVALGASPPTLFIVLELTLAGRRVHARERRLRGRRRARRRPARRPRVARPQTLTHLYGMRTL